MEPSGEDWREESLEAEVEQPAIEEIYIARQPIVDKNESLVAYELLFRSGATNYADVREHMLASSVVVHNAFNGMGIEAVLGKADGYINVDREFLLSSFVDLLPPNQVVLELLDTVVGDPDVLTRMRDLRKRGYKLALDIPTSMSTSYEQMLACVDQVKVDLLRMDPAALKQTVTELRRTKLKLVAEKVETKAQFEQVRNLGFDYFQGYYFARPQMLSSRQHANPAKFELLRLMGLIVSDADISVLESGFKRHPMLSYNLLRMANSAAMGLRTRIHSLRHAIILMGRRPLQSWMQLMLYVTRDRNGVRSPLLQTAAVRGKLMESMIRLDAGASQTDRDAAFMAGILSLVDVLLGLPRDTILSELFVSDDVRDALRDRSGKIGRLLRIAELLEQDAYNAVRILLRDVPGVSPEAVLQLQLDAFAWANAVEADVVRADDKGRPLEDRS